MFKIVIILKKELFLKSDEDFPFFLAFVVKDSVNFA